MYEMDCLKKNEMDVCLKKNWNGFSIKNVMDFVIEWIPVFTFTLEVVTLNYTI